MSKTEVVTLSEAEFRMFAELLRGTFGLHFGPESRYRLEQRVGRRMRLLGVGSFASYHYMLRHGSGGEEELAALVDDLTTNETYFFRELSQLQALIEEVLPEHLARWPSAEHGPMTVWSAGCSSGEEPYSIVMLALEAGWMPGRDVRVYASDISRSMLHSARCGIYRETSLRETSPELRRRYFVEREGSFRLADDVKKHVDFIHLNLNGRGKAAVLGRLDAIVCRNVMIYFDAEMKQRVIGTFYEKLRPGGHLLLGRAESLIHHSTEFELRHLSRDMVYRRPSFGGSNGETWQAEAADAVRRAGGDRVPE